MEHDQEDKVNHPNGEVGDLCLRLTALTDWLANNKPQSFVIPNFWSSRSADLRAAIAHLRRLGQVEAENALLRHRLKMAHEALTSKDHEDALFWIERALAPAPAAEGE